jgi:hypothetical protein
MTAKVAIATVSGKAYFLLVSELKEKNIEFLSVVPGQPVPAEAKIVITTEKEKSLVRHEKVLIYNGTDPHAIVNEAIKGLQGKESYEKIVIGIDPGEVTGLAVIADGKVNATKACFNIQEITNEVKTTITNLNLESTKVLVKIGNGVPLYKELLDALDSTLPPKVVLEVVSEAGTNKPSGMDKHRRGLRDITSAIRIAGREGYAYHRKIVTESEE